MEISEEEIAAYTEKMAEVKKLAKYKVQDEKKDEDGNSEKDTAKDFPEYREQVSFKKEDGIVKEVPYGTKGSVRPDLYKEGHNIDIKNIIFLHQVGEAA